MKAIWRLFADDVRRLTGNVAGVIVVIGLVAIPSLFAWFNIAASWDPFGNVRDLRFAVANDDEGYRSDLIPVKVTIGAEIVNELRADDRLDWTFTTRRDAIEGTKSGDYYAAIVIPKDFSARMMTFFSDDARPATITYYSNEKKNAVAPNLTNAGADAVTAQVNEMFAETLTETALGIASSLADRLDDPDARDALSRFDANVGDLAVRFGDAAALLDGYAGLADASVRLLDDSAELLGQAGDAIGSADDGFDAARDGVAGITDAFDAAADTTRNALTASADGIGQVGADIDALLDDATADAAATSAALRSQATAIDGHATAYRNLKETLAALPGAQDDAGITAAADALQRTIDQLDKLSTSLNDAADAIDAGGTDAATQRDAIDGLVTQARDGITAAVDSFDGSAGPQADRLAAAARDASSALSQNALQLDDAVGTLADTAGRAGQAAADVGDALRDGAGTLRNAGDELATFHASFDAALTAGDGDALRALLGADPAELAASLAAPVELDRKAVFPVDNFGSAMTPYYTFIPLWTASILIALAVSVRVPEGQRKRLGPMRPHQMFLGRFTTFATVSLLQSTVSCGGSLLFLRVQAVHPLLFMLSGWVGGLVFALFVYTMVVSFGNVGKAIGMLMLVFQVSGSAGSYPLQTLPGFMQRLSPFLPITHAIAAMRAAIAGIYMNDYWVELGKLVLFVPPLLLLGLLLRKPLAGLNRRLDAQLERTGLIG